MAQFTAQRIGSLLGQRPVYLTDTPFADHFVEPREGLRGLGEEHRAAHRTVDPVHHAEEHLAGLRIAAFDKGFDLVFEGTSARRVGLHQVSAVFVDHQQVVVFVENIFRCKHVRGIESDGSLSQHEREGQQPCRRIHDGGRTVSAHDDPHGRALAAFDIDHHLPTLAAGVALARGGIRSDGQRLDRVVGIIGLRVEHQRTFGAKPRRIHLALEIASVEDLPAAQARRRPDPEVRIGRVGVL